jgi:hypothetical protein
MNNEFTLEEIIPPYLEIVRGNHIKAYAKNEKSGFQIASAITDSEMLGKIISYLESNVENLKRHQKTSSLITA